MFKENGWINLDDCYLELCFDDERDLLDYLYENDLDFNGFYEDCEPPYDIYDDDFEYDEDEDEGIPWEEFQEYFEEFKKEADRFYKEHEEEIRKGLKDLKIR